ncbi:unnamed protein product [Gordionus sp. m RMFG-2023]|uniref:protein disulfide-isomerase A3-like n=1 Tax=Gordionus sp. m RMFG-2023 TaxID=3053472 RepID=UPI0030DEF929
MELYIKLASLLFLHLVFAGDNNVVKLDPNNFEQEVSGDFKLVEFYAPWCGHCKKLEPEYNAAADQLKKDGLHGFIAKVDCEANADLCKKHDVSGYPTLKVFKNGVYDSVISDIPRDRSGLINFIKFHTSPSYTEITNKNEMGLKDEYQIVALSTNDKKLEDFKNLAKHYKSNYKFAIVKDPKIIDNLEDKIVIYAPTDLRNNYLPNSYISKLTSYNEMKSFIDSKLPAFGDPRNIQNSKLFNEPSCVAYYFIDYKNNPKNSNFWRNRIIRALYNNSIDRASLSMGVSHFVELAHEMELFGFDVPTDHQPTSENMKIKPKIGCFNNKGQKYVMEEDFTESNFAEFIKKFLHGDIKPHLKSEPIPDPNNAGVKVVVAKNFDDIVNDKTKDVLLEFYAPWCGHCKSLAPKYDALAKELESEHDIVIAKMDATANDVPSIYKVQGYPTLYWVPKNKKDSPIPYDGPRETDGMVSYIAKHATDELTHVDRKGKPKKKSEL